MRRTDTRVMIADTQEVFREGIKAVLGQFDWALIVGEADDMQALIELIDRLSVDVVLLGLDMASGTYRELLDRIGRTDTKPCLVVIASENDRDELAEAIKLGADAFVLRSGGAHAFMAAVEAVANGRHYIQPELAGALARNDSLSPPQIRARLSSRQLRVISMLVSGFKNKQIAREVEVSETTVKQDLRVIYFELGASSRTEASAIATRIGLVE